MSVSTRQARKGSASSSIIFGGSLRRERSREALHVQVEERQVVAGRRIGTDRRDEDGDARAGALGHLTYRRGVRIGLRDDKAHARGLHALCEPGERRRGGRHAGRRLDGGDDRKAEALRKIGPALVHDDRARAAMERERPLPARKTRVQPGEEAVAIGGEYGAFLRTQAGEALE